jgi:CSLREA domain-containing protein
MLLCAAEANAATIKVNTTSDVVGNDGHCSLREALTAAATDTRSGTKRGECAAGSGADTIVLGAHKYVLSLVGPPDDTNAAGDLDVTAGVVTVLGATGSTTKVDAGGIDRAFDVLPGASLTLEKLTITGGAAPAGRQGLGGNIGLTGNPTGTASAGGTGGDSRGGAGGTGGGGGGVRNAGTLVVQNVELTLNHTGTGGNGGPASDGGTGGSSSASDGGAGGSSIGGAGAQGGNGGGLDSTAGSVTIRNSAVIGNATGNGGAGGNGAHGGTGGNGGGVRPGGKGGNCISGFGGEGGAGGGISLEGGTMTVLDSTVGQNATGTGGPSGTCIEGGQGGTGAGTGFGGDGGLSLAAGAGEGGFGGGISDVGGTLSVRDSTITANRAGDGGTTTILIGPGGPGGTGGAGGGGGGGGTSAGGFGGDGGFGGGVASSFGSSSASSVVLTNVTLRGNGAGNGEPGGDGGTGGTGGAGGGGNSTGGGGSTDGGFGGEGGAGGAASFQSSFRLNNVTMTGNQAGHGGTGGGGGNGPGRSDGGFGGEGGLGGAVFGEGEGALIHVTSVSNNVGAGAAGGAAGTGNPATAGQAEQDGEGGDLFSDGSPFEPPPISESASILASCAGEISDGGGNIKPPVVELGSTPCPGFPANPKLGPLANNGGPTRTMALLKGSPAIDRVPVPCGTMPDQRGVPRPQGHGCDSGAYEFAPPRVTTGGASAVSGKRATVAGVIVPDLRKTSWFVEYGRTTAYGKKTPVATLVGSLRADKVKAVLTGLAPHTVIHYRFVASNGDGTAQGADRTLKTARTAGVRIQAAHIANAALADLGERARAAATVEERFGG